MNLDSLNSLGAFRTIMHSRTPHRSKHSSAKNTPASEYKSTVRTNINSIIIIIIITRLLKCQKSISVKRWAVYIQVRMVSIENWAPYSVCVVWKCVCTDGYREPLHFESRFTGCRSGIYYSGPSLCASDSHLHVDFSDEIILHLHHITRHYFARYHLVFIVHCIGLMPHNTNSSHFVPKTVIIRGINLVNVAEAGARTRHLSRYKRVCLPLGHCESTTGSFYARFLISYSNIVTVCSQSATAVTHCILMASHITDPKGIELKSALSGSWTRATGVRVESVTVL